MLRGNKLVCDGINFLGKQFIFPDANRRFSEQVVTINEVWDDHYRIKEDNGEYCWIDEVFEGYAFEFGETADFSNDGEKWERRFYAGYIDGADYPYVAVNTVDEARFKKGLSFTCALWKYARPIHAKHTIIIDGVEIEVSDEDYEALKEKLCGGRNK